MTVYKLRTFPLGKKKNEDTFLQAAALQSQCSHNNYIALIEIRQDMLFTVMDYSSAYQAFAALFLICTDMEKKRKRPGSKKNTHQIKNNYLHCFYIYNWSNENI